MVSPLPSGAPGDMAFLMTLVIYSILSVLYLLFPLLLVSFLRNRSGRLGELVRADRPDVFSPRNR